MSNLSDVGMNARRLSVLLALLLLNNALIGQTMRGIVLDNDLALLSNINVALMDSGDSSILVFTTTGQDGRFALSCPDNHAGERWIVRASAVGYETYHLEISRGNIPADIRIVLNNGNLHLDPIEIDVSLPKANVLGDTVAYRVKAFADDYDRTIGDILRKLPGIQVEENGRISYQGQAISNLYIDGDDVLGDKYNIGTRSIPHRVVRQVQVLKNHQQVKMLEGKVFSDEVALNLELDEGAGLQLLGRIELGAGAPRLYQTEADLITLQKTWKSLNNMYLNNSGRDLTDMTVSLNLYGENLKRGYSRKADYLNAGVAGDPPLPRSRYFDNHSGLLNSSNLKRLDPETVLKFRTHYSRYSQDQLYRSQSAYYFPNDTISFVERQSKDMTRGLLHADMVYEANKADYFLSNTVTYDGTWADQFSDLQTQPLSFGNKLEQGNHSIANELKWMKIGANKSAAELFSYATVQNINENYALTFDQLNNRPDIELGNEQTLQREYVFLNHFFAKSFFGRRWHRQYKIGISNSIQRLFSETSLVDGSGGRNDFGLQDHRLYIYPTWQYENRDFRMRLSGQLQYQRLSHKEPAASSGKHPHNLLYEGNVRLQYSFLPALLAIASASADNERYDIMQVFPEGIFRNYRTVYLNEASDPYQQNQTATIQVKYEKPVKLLFATLQYSFRRNTRNYLGYSYIQNDLSIFSQRILDNRSLHHAVSINSEKYIFDWNMSISLKLGITRQSGNYWTNNLLLDNQTSTRHIDMSAEGKITDGITYRYQGGVRKLTYRSGVLPGQETSIQDHKATFRFNVSPSLFFSSSFESNRMAAAESRTTSYEFLDVELRYKSRKLRTDFSVNLDNILDVRSFENITLSAQSFFYTHYTTRPRQFVFTVSFVY
ncbi:MAG TPA: carboxypeptidase-like regulatory domain-containing protein [Sphingobacterium sp.]|nr:carboxypeptidase-like regulatory domain-containing protein [Sphingobacterium sp.]